MNLEQFLLSYEEDVNNIFDEAELPVKVRNKITNALAECFGIINLPLDPNDLVSIISRLADDAYTIQKDKAISIRENEFVKKIDHQIQFYVDADVYEEYMKDKKTKNKG